MPEGPEIRLTAYRHMRKSCVTIIPPPILLMNQIGKRFYHLIRAFRVQAGGRFIGQHYVRIVNQRPGNGYALLLPAG